MKFTIRSTSPAKRREGDRTPRRVSAEERVVEGASRRTALRRTLITNRARAMRKAMTEPEVMLWSRLRGRDGERPTFRRQHPLGAMILDFYCPSLRLALEVDGATHWDDEARRRDAARDARLQDQGIAVMRIPAGWIYRDLSGVMDAILLKIEALKPRAGA